MPAKTGAPEATELEITPEMIAAGAEKFLDYNCGAEIFIGTPEVAAEMIFRAMIDASRLGRVPA